MRILTALSIITACSTAASASANSYKSGELLTFSEGQREWFYTGAFMSIGHMVALKDENKAECVWGWYFKKPVEQTKVLEAALRRYPDHSPTAIIIGLVQQECGAL